MKHKKLYEEIGLIGDDIITEVEDMKPVSKKSVWYKFVAIAACFSIVAVSAMTLRSNRTNKQSWPRKELLITRPTEDEIAVVPKWDDLGISQQYNSLIFEGKTYYGTICKIDKDQLQGMIGEEILSGQDSDTEEVKYKEGKLYSINEIAIDCSVAVQLSGDKDYYVYRNSYYKPNTLGQLIEDLNLRNTMTFSSVWYQHQKGNGDYATIEFVNLENSMIWDSLLSDESLSNVEDFDSMWFHSIMDISVNIPLLGYENISLSLSDNGYITTNILDTGKAFYIGEDKVKAFVNYVLNNCEGYEIVYVNEIDSGDLE